MIPITKINVNIFLSRPKIEVLRLLDISKCRDLVTGLDWRLYVGMRLFFPNIFAIYVHAMLYQKP